MQKDTVEGQTAAVYNMYIELRKGSNKMPEQDAYDFYRLYGGPLPNELAKLLAEEIDS